MSYNPAKAFNTLPPLPPATNLETVGILKACIKARAALAELKQAGELLPNQELLINLLRHLVQQELPQTERLKLLKNEKLVHDTLSRIVKAVTYLFTSMLIGRFFR